jgi:hypothetical protein
MSISTTPQQRPTRFGGHDEASRLLWADGSERINHFPEDYVLYNIVEWYLSYSLGWTHRLSAKQLRVEVVSTIMRSNYGSEISFIVDCDRRFSGRWVPQLLKSSHPFVVTI